MSVGIRFRHSPVEGGRGYAVASPRRLQVLFEDGLRREIERHDKIIQQAVRELQALPEPDDDASARNQGALNRLRDLLAMDSAELLVYIAPKLSEGPPLPLMFWRSPEANKALITGRHPDGWLMVREGSLNHALHPEIESSPSKAHAPAKLDVWYQHYVAICLKDGRRPNVDEDWAAAKNELSAGVTQRAIREVRASHAPAAWKKRGRPKGAN